MDEDDGGTASGDNHLLDRPFARINRVPGVSLVVVVWLAGKKLARKGAGMQHWLLNRQFSGFPLLLLKWMRRREDLC